MKNHLMLWSVSALVVYAGTVILAGMNHPGYISEFISELAADGTPNLPLLGSLFVIYHMLLSLVGLRLFFKARNQPAGKIYGIIGSLNLIVVGIAGLLMELAFPQDPGEAPITFAGIAHVVAAGIASFVATVAALFLAIWVRQLPELKGFFVILDQCRGRFRLARPFPSLRQLPTRLLRLHH